ncbi:MAG: hypothetical protein FJ390_04090 [Verrucomicrobia bacterium]|nr:hypothetical protein [Verrucomicrobiota bacterium]
MFSTSNRGYAGIPSALPSSEKKMAASLNHALETWNDEDEIKYRQGENGQTPYYYSDSQQPEGLLESGQRFFAHLTNPEAHDLHSKGIDAVVKDLSAFPAKGAVVERDFKIRKMLGQPLYIGALKQSLARVTPSAAPQSSRPSSPINLLRKKPFPRGGSALRALTKDGSSFFRLFSGKGGYTSIPGDDGRKRSASASTSSPFSYQSGNLEMRTLTDEDFGIPSAQQQQQRPQQLPRSMDRLTSQDGTPQQTTSNTLSRYMARQAQQKKPSGYGSTSSAPPTRVPGQGPSSGDNVLKFNL